MDFSDVEEAIKAALAAAIPYAATVETYAGQLEGEIGSMTAPFPAIFVAYGGSAFDWVDGVTMSDEAEFTVIVAAKGLRGRGELRKGEHGCYRMVRDVLAALAHQRLGFAAMEPIKPASVALLFVSERAAAYGVTVQAKFDTDFKE